jgi:predicted SPOUT superfamily RNA methylase MTH1
VTVRVSSRRPVRARIVDEPLPGFAVERMDLQAALGREDAGLRIATSRHGEELTVPRLSDLAGRIERDGMTVAFGSPERGLPDMIGIGVADIQAAADEDATEPTAGGFDLWLNSIPNQGSEVVRTEEALFATLGCLTLTE